MPTDRRLAGETLCVVKVSYECSDTCLHSDLRVSGDGDTRPINRLLENKMTDWYARSGLLFDCLRRVCIEAKDGILRIESQADSPA